MNEGSRTPDVRQDRGSLRRRVLAVRSATRFASYDHDLPAAVARVRAGMRRMAELDPDLALRLASGGLVLDADGVLRHLETGEPALESASAIGGAR